MRRQFLKTLAVVVSVQMAEAAVQTLRDLQLIDSKFEFARTDQLIFIPIVRRFVAEETSKIEERCGGRVRMEETELTETDRKPKNFREAVGEEIPKEVVSTLPRSFDTVGDIAVLELPRELDQFAYAIGNGILKLSSNLRLVLRKSGDVSGIYRTREFEVIAGAGGTETIYREFSNRFRLDVATVYFNPKLSHERMRVTKQVKDGECVVDLFAGVGPYSILIAKNHPASKIYAIDINPEAYRYLTENVLMNRVADRVVPILGDARTIVRKHLHNVASRVIMNLPSESKNFVSTALEALAGRGVIHYYAFASRSETIDTVVQSIREEIGRNGRKVESVLFARILKEVAPSRVQVAVDLLVK